MKNILFFYENRWDKTELIASSHHRRFPASNTQDRRLTKPLRSNYGPASGWGTFIINQTNQNLYFKEQGQSQKTAVITSGTYNAYSLAAEIETQMESVGTHDFDISYDDTQKKFVIASQSGNFELFCWSLTTNAIWDVLGFSTDSDTGCMTDSYTADYIRIHTEETLKISSSNIITSGVFVFHHNIQESGIVKVQFSNDDFSAIEYEYTLSRGENKYVKLLHPSPLTYNDVRLHVRDVDNPLGYIEIGRVWVGDCFEPKWGFSPDFLEKPKDLSELISGDSGQNYSIQRGRLDTKTYSFELADPVEKFREIFKSRGETLPLVIVEKPISYPLSGEYLEPERNTHYCHLSSWSLKHIAGGKFSLKTARKEEK